MARQIQRVDIDSSRGWKITIQQGITNHNLGTNTRGFNLRRTRVDGDNYKDNKNTKWKFKDVHLVEYEMWTSRKVFKKLCAYQPMMWYELAIAVQKGKALNPYC